MHQYRLATEVHLVAELPGSQAEVDVLEAVAKLLVQSPPSSSHTDRRTSITAPVTACKRRERRGVRVIGRQARRRDGAGSRGTRPRPRRAGRCGQATAAGRRRSPPVGAPPQYRSSAASQPGNGRTSLLSRITYWPRATAAPVLHAAEKPKAVEGRTSGHLVGVRARGPAASRWPRTRRRPR